MSISETQKEIQQTEQHLCRLRDRLEGEINRQLQQPPPAPEQLIKGYPWPSSRITKADMMRLTELRTRTRRPITKLIHEAVGAYYRLLTDEE